MLTKSNTHSYKYPYKKLESTKRKKRPELNIFTLLTLTHSSTFGKNSCPYALPNNLHFLSMSVTLSLSFSQTLVFKILREIIFLIVHELTLKNRYN